MNELQLKRKPNLTLLLSTAKVLVDCGLNCEQMGNPISAYFGAKDGEVDFSGGYFISKEYLEQAKETELFKKFQLEGGEFYKTNHIGPYDKLSQTWKQVHEQIAKDGKKSLKIGFEKYISNPYVTKPEELLTEVYVKFE